MTGIFLITIFLVPPTLKAATPITGGTPLSKAELKERDRYPILAACTRYDDEYASLGFRGNITSLPNIYHARVNAVIEEHIKRPAINCNAANYGEVFRPGAELKSLAESLPPWQSGADLDKLTRLDVGKVLLEYLRAYECALAEFEDSSIFQDIREHYKGIRTVLDFFTGDAVQSTQDKLAIIKPEQKIARKALNRTLSIVTTIDRLKPLDIELECTQRISLDVRNLSALAADTSSCFPRTWNASDPLRDSR